MLKFGSNINVPVKDGNVTVFADDTDPNMFYVMPDQPSIRIDPTTGKYSFKFIEYQMPVDMPDGSTGGGFLIFDAVFVISPDTMQAVQKALGGKAKIGLPPFVPTPATTTPPVQATPSAQLTLLDSGGALVTKIESALKPSLFGEMTCSFTSQLSPEGAALVKAVMSPAATGSASQSSGGIIQIAYNLTFMAVLPDVTGRVWFDAVKFASYYQSIQKSGASSGLFGLGWGILGAHGATSETETMQEFFLSADCGGVKFDFSGWPPNDPNATSAQQALQNWGWQQLNIAVQNVLGASGGSSQGSSSGSGSQGSGSSSGDGSSGSSSSGSGSSGSSSSGGVTGQNTGSDLGSDRTDDGMNNITRNESSFSSFSFDETYDQKSSILMPATPQGTLPNVPNFNNYVTSVNLDDPFFKQLHATISVDADFAKFSIQSVDVNLTYDRGAKLTPPIPPTIGGHHFTSGDDVYHFDSNTVNGDMSYSYAVSVNYLDQNAPFTQPPATITDAVKTIDIGTMGTFYVNISMVNIDFTKTPTVLVEIKYPDPDSTGNPIDRQFSFNSTTMTASLIVVTMKTTNKPYQYQVTYVMADGTQFMVPWTTYSSQQLSIKSPFSQQTVSFIAEGDFTNEINNIFLKMTYVDATNNFQQTSDYTFSSSNRSHDWSFPIISGGQGVIHYSGVVTNINNTTENIPDTTSTSSLITFGPPNQAIITVTPDATLLDFTKVQLVQVNFSYADPANNIALTQEIVLKPAGATPPSWTFYVKDPTKTAYTYQVTYYMAGSPPTQVQQPPATSSNTDLIITMPVAAAA